MCPVVPSWNRIYSVLGAPDSVGHGGIGLDRAVELGSLEIHLPYRLETTRQGLAFCSVVAQNRVEQDPWFVPRIQNGIKMRFQCVRSWRQIVFYPSSRKDLLRTFFLFFCIKKNLRIIHKSQ